jgi:hypothetical protein
MGGVVNVGSIGGYIGVSINGVSVTVVVDGRSPWNVAMGCRMAWNICSWWLPANQPIWNRSCKSMIAVGASI